MHRETLIKLSVLGASAAKPPIVVVYFPLNMSGAPHASASSPAGIGGENVSELDAGARLGHHALDRVAPALIVSRFLVPRGVRLSAVNFDQQTLYRWDQLYC